jgi:hypothetical protein
VTTGRTSGFRRDALKNTIDTRRHRSGRNGYRDFGSDALRDAARVIGIGLGCGSRWDHLLNEHFLQLHVSIVKMAAITRTLPIRLH